MRAAPTLALFAGAVAIATAPILVRWSETGPLATAFWRVLLSLPVAWVWWRSQRRTATPAAEAKRSCTILLWTGLFFAGDLGVWHVSLLLTPVANSTLLVNTAPFFVTLGGWWLFRQHVRPLFWLAMLVAFLGASLMVQASFSVHPRRLAGDGLAVVAAVSYAGYILAVSRARLAWPTAGIMFFGGSVTCAALLPVVLLAGERVWPKGTAGWLTLAALAAVPQLVGQSLITFALAHLPASFSSVGLLVQPVLAALFAWMVLNEAIAPLQALGGLTVLAGIALARRAQG